MLMDTTTENQAALPDALEALGKAADAYRDRERQAMVAKATRDNAMVAAQAAGATYPQMAAAAKVSRDRVAQVLARKRQES